MKGQNAHSTPALSEGSSYHCNLGAYPQEVFLVLSIFGYSYSLWRSRTKRKGNRSIMFCSVLDDLALIDFQIALCHHDQTIAKFCCIGKSTFYYKLPRKT